MKNQIGHTKCYKKSCIQKDRVPMAQNIYVPIIHSKLLYLYFLIMKSCCGEVR